VSSSITLWLERLRAGDPQAAQPLWERFAQRMLEAARRSLGAATRRVADEEDVVVVAFERFLDGVRQGRFPQLNDRDDLWAVLLTLTRHAARDQVRDQARQKRGGGEVRGDSAWQTADGQRLEPAGDEPGPDELADFQEQLERLLEGLGDEGLRRIALGKLAGHTNGELAVLLACAEVTIERRLRVIRRTWQALG
jgi:DNA-directed RNA polymerase specialized sigma24 family protein